MKRCVLILLLFIFLGAAVNLLLIYGVFLRIDYTLIHSMPLQDDEWLVERGAIPTDSDLSPGILREEHSPSFGTYRIDYWADGGLFAYRASAGWPCFAVSGGYYIDPVTNRLIEDGALFLSSAWASDFWAVLALPVRPVWLGMALNTMFYAAILWLLIRGPFALRRALRIRKRRCPACGYPFGESPVCTECGRDVSRRVAKRA